MAEQGPSDPQGLFMPNWENFFDTLEREEEEIRETAFVDLHRQVNRLTTPNGELPIGAYHQIPTPPGQFVYEVVIRPRFQRSGEIFSQVIINKEGPSSPSIRTYSMLDYIFFLERNKISLQQSEGIYNESTNEITFSDQMGPLIIGKPDGSLTINMDLRYRLKFPDGLSQPTLDENIQYRMRAQKLGSVLSQLSDDTLKTYVALS